MLVLVHERVMIAFKTRSFEIITHLVNIDGHFHHIFFIIAIFPNKKTLQYRFFHLSIIAYFNTTLLTGYLPFKLFERASLSISAGG